jgi:phospholipid/cholesterol/gamma-HCH transport system ATP-binding protein
MSANTKPLITSIESPKLDVKIVAELRAVQFAYQDRIILSDLTMQFRRGQVIAIMGGSGSGKTTILRLLGGLIRTDVGQILVGNQSVSQLNQPDLFALRRRMGMLFQFGALFTDLSVFDNVAFALREHTQLPELLIRDIVLMKLHTVGLRGAAQLMPAEISGGMARRVALARAMVLDPELMLYDEPFAGLDPISMGITANLIRTLNDALGATSIVVSHDVDETFSIADYVYFLSKGTIAAHGTPSELRESTDPFVVQFIQGHKEGPMPFHYPAENYAHQLGVTQ